MTLIIFFKKTLYLIENSLRTRYLRRNRKSPLIFLFIVFFLLIVIFGCGRKVNPGSNETRTVLVTPFSTTLYLKETVDLKVTTTPIAQESFPFPTAYPSKSIEPILTSTDFPILNLTSQQKLMVMDFLVESPDCVLPCWNELTPGESSTAEIPGFFARLGYDYHPFLLDLQREDGEFAGDIRDFPPGSFSKSTLMIHLRWHQDSVDLVEINSWDHPEQINMKRIGEILGNPDQIMVLEAEGSRYSILLHYFANNTVIIIRGIRELIDTNRSLPFEVCINDTTRQNISAIFYSSFIFSELQDEYTQYPWVSWDALLGLRTEELFSQLQQGICLQYP